MPESKHPLVTGDIFYGPSNLIRQRLKAQLMVGFGKRTRYRIRGTANTQNLQQAINGFVEPAGEQMLVSDLRNFARIVCFKSCGEVITKNGSQKEKCPHPMIKVGAFPPKFIQSDDVRKEVLGCDTVQCRFE